MIQPGQIYRQKMTNGVAFMLVYGVLPVKKVTSRWPLNLPKRALCHIVFCLGPGDKDMNSMVHHETIMTIPTKNFKKFTQIA